MPATTAKQLVGMLHGMAELVPEQLQTLVPRASFDLEHHVALEAHQSRVGQVEGHRDARHVLQEEEEHQAVSGYLAAL